MILVNMNSEPNKFSSQGINQMDSNTRFEQANTRGKYNEMEKNMQ